MGNASIIFLIMKLLRNSNTHQEVRKRTGTCLTVKANVRNYFVSKMCRNIWISWRWPIEKPPRSADLTTLSFSEKLRFQNKIFWMFVYSCGTNLFQVFYCSGSRRYMLIVPVATLYYSASSRTVVRGLASTLTLSFSLCQYPITGQWACLQGSPCSCGISWTTIILYKL